MTVDTRHEYDDDGFYDDKQVSHGKMGDWNLALTAIREIARAALSKYRTDATKGTDNGG